MRLLVASRSSQVRAFRGEAGGFAFFFFVAGESLAEVVADPAIVGLGGLRGLVDSVDSGCFLVVDQVDLDALASDALLFGLNPAIVGLVEDAVLGLCRVVLGLLADQSSPHFALRIGVHALLFKV